MTCLDFGFLAAMVRISRGQYTSPKTLKAGMDRFWPLIRCTVLKNLLYCGMLIGVTYLSVMLFMLSPFSDQTVAILSPVVSDASILSNGTFLLDEITQMALLSSLKPAFVIWGIVFLLLFVPMAYRLRFSHYVLYDNPGIPALVALRESRKLMRRNILPLFMVDLSFWWYYLLFLLASAVAWGETLLSMVGITLPFPDMVNFFLFYFLSMAIQLLLFYYLRCRVETTYACAYNAIRPKEDNSGNGVVLGNIFQM